MIKNIIFDLSEVIITGYHDIEFVVAKHENIKPEDFWDVKKAKIDRFLEAMRGTYTEDEYLDYLMKDTDWKFSKEKLKEYIRENMNVPVEGTLEIIKKLKNNYKLILLSDHIVEWVDYILQNNKDLELFEKKYFSYEYGKIKTDEGVFEYVTKDSNLNPEETVFIDDSAANVANAEKLGIKGIVFKNATQLEQDLKNLGITL